MIDCMKTFDFETDVELDGVFYYVSLNFNWAVDAVDMEFRPYMGERGMQRDLYALVAEEITERVVKDEQEQDVTDKALADKLVAMAEEKFVRSGKATKNPKWGRWA